MWLIVFRHIKLNHTDLVTEKDNKMARVEIKGVACFGILEDDSNIEILFDDEQLDFIWLTRDPIKYPTWTSIVSKWQEKADEWGCTLVEIQTD